MQPAAAVGTDPLMKAAVGEPWTPPVTPMAAWEAAETTHRCGGGGGCGRRGSPSLGVDGGPFGERARGGVPVVAGGYGHGEPGRWTGQGTDRAGDDGVSGIEGADPASPVNVDDGFLLDVLGWAGNVGNGSPGGGDSTSAGDGKYSLKYILDHPLWNRRRDQSRSGDRKGSCLGCDGRSAPGVILVGTVRALNLVPAIVSRAASGSGGEAP